MPPPSFAAFQLTTTRLRELAHDDGGDRIRGHGVADEPAVRVDDAEAGGETERDRRAHATDRVDRPHRVDARAPEQGLEDGDPAGHLLGEDAVTVDAVGHGPDVVGCAPPRQAHRASPVARDVRKRRHPRSRPVGRVEALEEAGVLHVVPGAAVAVVVVAPDVEHAGLERAVLQRRRHQVGAAVADVPAGAAVRRRAAVHGAERVHELVRRDDDAHVVPVARPARVEVDDGHTGQAAAPLVRLAADPLATGLARWPVEVDEIGLLRLAERVLGRKQLPHARIGAPDVGHGRGQRHAREVE